MLILLLNFKFTNVLSYTNTYLLSHKDVYILSEINTKSIFLSCFIDIRYDTEEDVWRVVTMFGLLVLLTTEVSFVFWQLSKKRSLNPVRIGDKLFTLILIDHSALQRQMDLVNHNALNKLSVFILGEMTRCPTGQQEIASFWLL